MVGAVIVAAVIGYGRAVDLMSTVDAFQRFQGAGSNTVVVAEAGSHTVYHEYIDGMYGSSYSSDTLSTDGLVTVAGPDGTAVPVRASSVTYGWGSRQGEGVVSFDAAVPGTYQIGASDSAGRLAFGPTIPGAPVYGMEGVLLVTGLVLAACVVAAVLLARRRSSPRPASPGEDGDRRSLVPVVACVSVIVVAAAAGAIAVSGLLEDEADEIVMSDGDRTSRASGQPAPGIECRSDADFETGLCGVPPEELREMNLHYADRVEFTGDIAAATRVADQARMALEPLAPILPAPAPEQVQGALAPVGYATVSSTAVRTAGTAFGIGVDGGCVFGSVHDGTVDVEIGGYVNDGGCLASYGH
jgi:hypothetical protein